MTDIPFDPEHAVDRAGDDRELAQQIAELFVVHVPDWVAELRTALSDGDSKTTHRLAHTIKSSADNAGCHRVRSVAAEIERLARGDDGDTMSELFDTLTGAVDEAIPEVERFTGDD